MLVLVCFNVKISHNLSDSSNISLNGLKQAMATNFPEDGKTRTTPGMFDFARNWTETVWMEVSTTQRTSGSLSVTTVEGVEVAVSIESSTTYSQAQVQYCWDGGSSWCSRGADVLSYV